MDLIIATANVDKVQEIREILADIGLNLISMREAGFVGDIAETGLTYEENALLKARAVQAVTGGWVLADDSGLSVDVLDGAPGIYSARFAGEEASYPDKIAQLHAWLRAFPPDQWQASFICVIALIDPAGRAWTVRGECRGQIAGQPRGQNGFGYDPIFFLPDRGLTMAELDPAAKHALSHRGQALRAAAGLLRKELNHS